MKLGVIDTMPIPRPPAILTENVPLCEHRLHMCFVRPVLQRIAVAIRHGH